MRLVKWYSVSYDRFFNKKIQKLGISMKTFDLEKMDSFKTWISNGFIIILFTQGYNKRVNTIKYLT